jgi:hypothetical protein
MFGFLTLHSASLWQSCARTPAAPPVSSTAQHANHGAKQRIDMESTSLSTSATGSKRQRQRHARGGTRFRVFA